MAKRRLLITVLLLSCGGPAFAGGRIFGYSTLVCGANENEAHQAVLQKLESGTKNCAGSAPHQIGGWECRPAKWLRGCSATPYKCVTQYECGSGDLSPAEAQPSEPQAPADAAPAPEQAPAAAQAAAGAAPAPTQAPATTAPAAVAPAPTQTSATTAPAQASPPPPAQQSQAAPAEPGAPGSANPAAAQAPSDKK